MGNFYDERDVKDLNTFNNIKRELEKIRYIVDTNKQLKEITEDLRNIDKIFISEDIKKKGNRRKKVNRRKENKSYDKYKEKKYLNKLYKEGHMVVQDEGDYLKRVYRGKRSKFLKKLSNKKLRNSKSVYQTKGSNFKKVFDFWWELY